MHPDSLLRLLSYINHLLTYTSDPATVRQLTCYGTLENVGIILTIDKTINISLTVNTDRQHGTVDSLGTVFTNSSLLPK